MTQGLASGNTVNLPAGTIQMYAGATAPSGWVLCNGAAISRTTNASLFAICGVTYGVGDGSTTFNVPDFAGVFPRGAGTSTKLTNANSTAFAGTLGTYQNDKIQGHWHNVFDRNSFFVDILNISYSAGGTGFYKRGTTGALRADVYEEDTLNNTGTPRTGLETNPANLSISFIIKT